MTQKPRNFFKLRGEAELLTKVAQGIVSEGSSILVDNIVEVKEALTKLQLVAKRYREGWKIGELKTHWYRDSKYLPYPKEMCFYQPFKDLSSKNYLTTIRVASNKLSSECKRVFRKTGLECAKKYCSLYRALEQQAHRLDTTLGRVVYEVATGELLTPIVYKYPRPPKKVKPVKEKDYYFVGDYMITVTKLDGVVIKTSKRKVKDDGDYSYY